jgi:hypothetical protein
VWIQSRLEVVYSTHQVLLQVGFFLVFLYCRPICLGFRPKQVAKQIQNTTKQLPDVTVYPPVLYTRI